MFGLWKTSLSLGLGELHLLAFTILEVKADKLINSENTTIIRMVISAHIMYTASRKLCV